MLMKYKDFKQMSNDEMKNVKGGLQEPGGGDGKYCLTTACTITILSGGQVEGTCGTITGSGMTLDQCGCIKSGQTSQVDSSCNPKPGA